MIYRDLDGEMYEFICIKYGLDNNPETSILRFTKKPQNVNFAELFKVGEPPQIDTKKNILNKIVIQ